jgi:hypothetical protein
MRGALRSGWLPFATFLALAAFFACSLQGGAKDACASDSDCNPGRVCTNGTCGPPGSSMEDGGVGDASGDVAADVPPPFCKNTKPPYTICDDFDEDAQAKNILVGWDNVVDNMDLGVSGGGTIAGSTMLPYTPPRSIFFSLPSLQAPQQAVANLMKTVKSPATLGLQFEFYIQTQYITGNERLELVFVDFNRAAGFAVVLGDKGLEAIVAVGSPPVDKTYTTLAPVILGMWHKLVLAMVIDSADAGSFAIFLDGNGEAAGPLPTAFADAGADEVDIGPAAQGPMGAFEVYVDNVLIQ